MTYFTEADRPLDGGTRFAYKCPVCGSEWAITFPPGVEVVATDAAECERCRGKAPAVPPT
jgi:DNA-directed RNA polymerase subunit RPC12/RpoP